jgi:hypothetical protein
MERIKDDLIKQVPPFDPKSPRTSNPKKLAKVPCSRLRQRKAALEAVKKQRQDIQDECFENSTDPGHQEAIDQLDSAIANTEEWIAKNCAPGNPMAEL